ncbi:hypothetical protein LTR53_018891, partial [Teratosphaeriaceae sp. CCFEE 6253]
MPGSVGLSTSCSLGGAESGSVMRGDPLVVVEIQPLLQGVAFGPQPPPLRLPGLHLRSQAAFCGLEGQDPAAETGIVEARPDQEEKRQDRCQDGQEGQDRADVVPGEDGGRGVVADDDEVAAALSGAAGAQELRHVGGS